MKDYEIFANYCKTNLDLENTITVNPDYKSLTLCIIDCIYSLRAKYIQVTLPIVKRYADKYLNGDMHASDTLEDFMNNVNQYESYDSFAEEVLKNMQFSGPYRKSRICYEVARKLRLLGINTFSDFRNYPSTEILEIVLKSVKGVGDAALNYLFMLAGDQNRCKPDVHIKHCVRDALGYDLNSDQDYVDLFRNAVNYLASDYPKLTARKLDNIIWTKYST